ncbi:dynein light intermediate chain-domain-containing protein [Phycomyces nitens]|nr:dynein light intermediate chain-domain-containing protein [Phycomyces nitens]
MTLLRPNANNVTPLQSHSTSTLTTQAPEKDEIWSTILRGVASSKMVPTKNVLILGDPKCGKSTLIHYLKHDPGPQIPKVESDDVQPGTSFGVSSHPYTMAVDNLDKGSISTLALGYTFVDVQDEENEAMARLGLYQLGLSSPEYQPLLKFALNSDTLADSFVILCLDWTRPWKFLETLERWIDVLQRSIQEICKEGSVGESWSRGKAIVDDLREKVEHYLKTYSEPTANAAPLVPSSSTITASPTTTSVPSTPLSTGFLSTPLVTTTTAADQVTLPLTQGCLTNNLGVSMAIVCCKSDAINTLEQTQDYDEDQFDFIQQTLRCVCMKYGAALIYTSTLYPHTFHNLRQYILHRLLTRSTKSFPFSLKAQVVERDSVFVPSGWDSWGKIRILKEGFDCEGLSAGWDADMEAVADRQQPDDHGARGFYEEATPNPDTGDMPLNIPPIVVCEDEQVFLERHFETLQRAPEVLSRNGTGSDASLSRPSVVGPLGISSLTLDATKSDNLDSDISRQRKESPFDKLTLGKASSNSSNGSIDRLHGFPGTSVTSHGHAGSTGSLGNGATGEGAGPSHEVLANFFQSLISKKATSAGPTPQTGSPTGSSSPALSLLGNQPLSNRSDDGTGRRPLVSRKDVYKELDKMSQYVNK